MNNLTPYLHPESSHEAKCQLEQMLFYAKAYETPNQSI